MSDQPTSVGQPTSIEQLLGQRDWLARMARALLHDPAAADDAVQATWLHALEHPPSGPLRSVRAWLATVLRQRVRDQWRTDSRRAQREERATRERGDEGGGVDGVVAEFELHESIAREVLSLREPYRTTLLLRYYQGLTLPAVAERMAVPCETVKTRVRRGLAELRERLDARNERGRAGWAPALAGLVRLPAEGGAGGAPSPLRVVRPGVAAGLLAVGAVLLGVGGAFMTGAFDAQPVETAQVAQPVEPMTIHTTAGQGAAPAPEPPAAAARIGGVVRVGGRGELRAGIAVRLHAGGREQTAVTDGAGRFVFEDAPIGERTSVTASAPDHVPATVRLEPTPGENDVGCMWLDVGAGLEVRVRGIDGALVEGATVLAMAFGGPVRETQRGTHRAETDAEGAARFPPLAGSVWNVLAYAPGHGVAIVERQRLGAGGTRVLELHLPRGHPVHGTVVDASGAPVAGATVVASQYPYRPTIDGIDTPWGPTVETDSQGRFLFEGLAARPALLQAKRAADVQFGTAPLRLDVPAARAVQLRLGAGGAVLFGRVTTQAGQPVAGLSVGVGVDGESASVYRSTTTDATGAYRIERLPVGAVDGYDVEHTVVVLEPDVDRPPRDLLVAGEPTERNFVVRVKQVLRVRVTDDVGPLPGSYVTAYFETAAGVEDRSASGTDPDGWVEFPGLPPGRVLVTVRHAGHYQPTPNGEPVGTDPADPRNESACVVIPTTGNHSHTVTLARGRDVRGVVLDERGIGVGGVPIRFGRTHRRTASGPDGSFVLVGLRPGASVQAMVPPGEWELAQLPGPITVPRDESEDVTVELRVRPATTVVLSATVTDASGSPIEGAALVRSDGSHHAVSRFVKPDGTVTWRLPRGLVQGCRLTATAPGHVSQWMFADPRSVAAGALRWDIRLQPLQRVSGRVLLDGNPFAGAEIHRLASSRSKRGVLCGVTDEDGAFTCAVPDAAQGDPVFAPGQGYCLVATAPGHWSRPRLAASGEALFELTPTRRVQGRVLSTDGRPVVWADVSLHVQDAGNAPAGPAQVAGDACRVETTKSDGSFVFDDLWDASFVVRVGAGEGLPTVLETSIGRAAAGGEETVLRVPTGGTIRGRIVGADGGTPTGLVVQLEPADAEQPRATAQMRDGNEFEFTSARPGRHTVHAAVRQYAAPWLESLRVVASVDGVESGADDVRLVVPDLGAVRGSLRDATGKPVWTEAVFLVPAHVPAWGAYRSDVVAGTRPNTQGVFRFGYLPPGSYRLCLEGSRKARLLIPCGPPDGVESDSDPVAVVLPRLLRIGFRTTRTDGQLTLRRRGTDWVREVDLARSGYTQVERLPAGVYDVLVDGDESGEIDLDGTRRMIDLRPR